MLNTFDGVRDGQRGNRAVEPLAEWSENTLDDRVVDERPCGIVNEDDEGILGHIGQCSTHRLGSRRAAGDARDDLRRGELLGEKDRRLLPTGSSSDDDRVDPRRAVEAVEALGEERPPAEAGESLRAIDVEPRAGARSEEERPDISAYGGNV
jgi:hypothetical protein